MALHDEESGSEIFFVVDLRLWLFQETVEYRPDERTVLDGSHQLVHLLLDVVDIPIDEYGVYVIIYDFAQSNIVDYDHKSLILELFQHGV